MTAALSKVGQKYSHGRSVTEIWGRDEMKNADLWGTKQRIWTFRWTKLQIGSFIHKSLKNCHIMAKR